MSLLAVFMAGLILGRKYGTLSVIIYILLGITGVPVFAGAKGGLAVMLGATGGFLIGYILCVFVVGFVADRFTDEKVLIGLGMVISVIMCYVPGICWYHITTGNSFNASLKLCVIPFIPGDVVKIVISMFLYFKIKPRIDSVIKR
jgi:biotin transport system substrate-specific component